MGKRADLAEKYFSEGYNCSQAVFCAFADKLGIDEESAKKLSIGFGGGFGRLREVCGAFSGMTMLAGHIVKTDLNDAHNSKTDVYEKVRFLKEEFENANGGSIICRELLGLDGASPTHVPEKRTEEYKQKRPCAEIVKNAALIMEEYFE